MRELLHSRAKHATRDLPLHQQLFTTQAFNYHQASTQQPIHNNQLSQTNTHTNTNKNSCVSLPAELDADGKPIKKKKKPVKVPGMGGKAAGNDDDDE